MLFSLFSTEAKSREARERHSHKTCGYKCDRKSRKCLGGIGEYHFLSYSRKNYYSESKAERRSVPSFFWPMAVRGLAPEGSPLTTLPSSTRE